MAAVNAIGFAWLAARPIRNPTSLPRLVRVAYGLFTVILLASGTALLTGFTDVMPWPIDGDTAAIFGWIFFSDAFYFLYPALRPHWECGRAQLWSFLAYDLVLIGPLIDHFSVVPSDLRINLVLYLAVLFGSGGLCVYYLTRRRPAPQPIAGS